MSFWNSLAFAGLHQGETFGFTPDAIDFFNSGYSTFDCADQAGCIQQLPHPITTSISVPGFWSNWPTPSGTTLGAWSPVPDFIDLYCDSEVGSQHTGYSPACKLLQPEDVVVCDNEIFNISLHTVEGDGGETYLADGIHGSIGGPTDSDGVTGFFRTGWLARGAGDFAYTGDPDNDASRILLPWPSIDSFDWILDGDFGRIALSSFYQVRTWYFNVGVETNPLMMVV